MSAASPSLDSPLRLLRTAPTICLQFLVARFAVMFSLVLMQLLQTCARRRIQLFVPCCDLVS
jgi:hypothetical protein